MQSNDPGLKAECPSAPDPVRTSITALATVLFFSGLALSFLADRAYSREYMPSERLGYEWLFKGTVQNVRSVARRMIKSQPRSSKSYPWFVGTSAILCLPVSLPTLRKRPWGALCLSVFGIVGVVGVFVLASPSWFVECMGLGFIFWVLSAVLAMVLCIRALRTKPFQELSSPTAGYS